MKQLYVTNNKLALIKNYGGLSMELILKHDVEEEDPKKQRPNIAALAKTEEQDVLTTIELIVVDLCKSLNVRNNMTPTQIQEAAILIMQTYGGIKMEEVFIVINEIKIGKRKIYERLDSQVLMAAFADYFENRCRESERLNYNKHLERKNMIVGNERTSDLRPFQKSITEAARKFALEKMQNNGNNNTAK